MSVRAPHSSKISCSNLLRTPANLRPGLCMQIRLHNNMQTVNLSTNLLPKKSISLIRCTFIGIEEVGFPICGRRVVASNSEVIACRPVNKIYMFSLWDSVFKFLSVGTDHYTHLRSEIANCTCAITYPFPNVMLYRHFVIVSTCLRG